MTVMVASAQADVGGWSVAGTLLFRAPQHRNALKLQPRIGQHQPCEISVQTAVIPLDCLTIAELKP